MMNYSHSLAAILGVGVALVQMQPAQSLTKVEVSKVAQGVTVMIQNAQNPQDTGSGFIIKREGETYTVLTAQHVVKNSPAYRVLTPCSLRALGLIALPSWAILPKTLRGVPALLQGFQVLQR
jgi:S1-C subfamily serine protease